VQDGAGIFVTAARSEQREKGRLRWIVAPEFRILENESEFPSEWPVYTRCISSQLQMIGQPICDAGIVRSAV